jgi:hypothetical protein
MDEPITLVFASFLRYALYVLLSIIPAAVIFELFPNTSLALSGRFDQSIVALRPVNIGTAVFGDLNLSRRLP